MHSIAKYQQIRQVVDSYLPGVRILLFGSHARGGADMHSDYDLLIITPQTFTPKEKIQWSTRLDKALVAAIKAPVDVLLNSEEEVKEKQSLPGHIIRSAVREGIAI